MLTQAPTYFSIIHGLNISAAGVFSGIPHLLKLGFCIVFSRFVDKLLRKKRFSRTNIRKCCVLIMTVGEGICIFGLAYSGSHKVMAILWYTLACILHGAGPSGGLSTLIDLSPNYAGVLLGILSTVTASTGYITPLIVGVLTNNNVSIAIYLYRPIQATL